MTPYLLHAAVTRSMAERRQIQRPVTLEVRLRHHLVDVGQARRLQPLERMDQAMDQRLALVAVRAQVVGCHAQTTCGHRSTEHIGVAAHSACVRHQAQRTVLLQLGDDRVGVTDRIDQAVPEIRQRRRRAEPGNQNRIEDRTPLHAGDVTTPRLNGK